MLALVRNPFRRFATAPAAPPSGADPARRVVLGGWALLTAALAGYVIGFGQNAPLSDEWGFLGQLTGEQPLLPWVWGEHNEHFFPLPRLTWVALHRLSGFDFRVPMLVSVALMAGAAYALVVAARRARGRSSVADLLIPALLLHLGHWENWLIGYQLAFTIPTAAACFIAAAVAAAPDPLRGRTLGACGLGLLVLVLCGGSGVILAVPLAGWVAVTSLRTRRYAALAAALAALAYATAYVLYHHFRGFQKPPSDWGEKAVTAVEVLAGGFGPVGLQAWPLSGIVAGGIFLVTGVRLARVAVARAGADRAAALGLLAVLVGVVGIAAAIGVSRAGFGAPGGFSPRYGLFAAAGLAVAVVTGARFPGGLRFPGAAVAGILTAVVVVALAVPNGLGYGRFYQHYTRDMLFRVRQGEGPDELAGRFVKLLYAGEDTLQSRGWMTEGLQIAARHRIGAYRGR